MASRGDESDGDLVEAALAGDTSAFSTLMSRHKDGLYRFIRRYVGDAEEAFDLVQESFVAAWTALHGFDRSRSFPVWLRRIALNKCRDWSRRRKVRQFFFGAAPLDAADRVAAPRPSDLDSNISTERRLAALDAAIAALPSALKEPLLLTSFEGLSHQEAAQFLHLTPKGIETRIYRAKQRLRAALDKADGEG